VSYQMQRTYRRSSFARDFQNLAPQSLQGMVCHPKAYMYGAVAIFQGFGSLQFLCHMNACDSKQLCVYQI
jgi:hypothetical protein